MAKPRKTKKDLKRKSETLALTEQCFAWGCEVGHEICSLALRVVLTVAAAVSLLHGAPWPVVGTLAGLSMFSRPRGSPKE
jgi:hypothetical protein